MAEEITLEEALGYVVGVVEGSIMEVDAQLYVTCCKMIVDHRLELDDCKPILPLPPMFVESYPAWQEVMRGTKAHCADPRCGVRMVHAHN
jgi:hypothetical protein